MRRLTALVALLLSVALGCSPAGQPADPRAAFDPQGLDLSPASLHQKFDGSPGRIALGTGWYGLEHTEQSGPWSAFSWATQEASLYFGRPLPEDVELVIDLAPFDYPGAPPQALVIVLNGTALPSTPVAPDWQELRIPLPASALRAPLNMLELKFAHAATPAKVIASTDPRLLAAVVSQLAIVRRGQPIAAADSELRGSGATRDATLGAEGLAIPLPAGRSYRLRFAATETPPRPDATLAVEVSQGGDTRQIWSGSVERRVKHPLTFSVTGRGVATVRIRATPADGSVAVRISAPEFVARDTPLDRPNVFFYVIDTLRADALGAYGYERPTSPRIDAFARQATLYERASSAAAWTLPSTVSILSGVYPFDHGMTEMGSVLPAGDVPWLPETLSSLGYETVALSQWPLGRPFGLDRGFDTYTLDVRLMTKSYSELARGLLWQYLAERRTPQKPLFAYIHVSDVHAVYDPKGEDRVFADRFPGALASALYSPQSFMAGGHGRDRGETAHLRALYDGEILYADRQFGAFLDLLRYTGLYDDSIIVLVSDHGEEFFEHGGFDHGRTLYQELLHVPLVVKLPGQRDGARIAARVHTLDLPPTILELLGRADVEKRFQGRPLPRADAAAVVTREIFAEARVGGSDVQGAVDLSALVAADVKCIRNALPVDRFGRRASGAESYDLAADPAEHSPLMAGDARATACLVELDRWLARARAGGKPASRKGPDLSAEEIRRLRALGYLR